MRFSNEEQFSDKPTFLEYITILSATRRHSHEGTPERV